jgi:hypothetical protein
MRIELLVVPECPHEGLVRAEAERRNFIGSPTVCVDGVDLFPEPGRTPSVACRFYAGGAGGPDLRELRRALKEAAATAQL